MATFELLKTTEHSIRLGRMTILRNHERKILNTPNCLACTARGSVPHLTPDSLREIPVEALEITLEQFLDVQPPPSSLFPNGAHKFFNLEEYLLFFDVRDPGELKKIPFNTDKFASVITSQGIRKITPDDYVKYVNSYNPEMFASLSDTITAESPSPKRIKKSVNRTLTWLDHALANIKEGIHVFGAVVGHDNHEERVRSAQETANRKVAGFVLNGHDLGNTSKERLDILKTSINHLPKDKIRIAYGIEKPADILRGILEGIDVFDASYPSKMTSAGKAFVFSLNNDKWDTDTGCSQHINLLEGQYRTDYQPFIQTCKCYACRNHTRAYVHHLLNAREMLANVLLMSHNLYHYSQFFKKIRESMEQDTFLQFAEQFLQRYGEEEYKNDHEVTLENAEFSINQNKTEHNSSF
ncbi:14877_t:CDS:2 [Acaulospora morrowiae]|uniref:Queuine tRNA-ribosyltransferase accessory subunit 2 n=1 Tax=Acaulospora morrowiae TaxID=94023 RepID=A0A9N9ER86_9GLOM|nr:14877_t:CDS:2 [Acaulospora morrowiae]